MGYSSFKEQIMAKLSDSDRSKLSRNSNVLKVTTSNVTYTPKFKLKAVQAFSQGKTPKGIFEEAGIDLSLFHEEYPKFSVKRWKRAFDKYGIDAFKEEHRGSGATGRPSRKFRSLEEEVNYLRSEIDLLKKLQALAKKKSLK
jgi:hypothetical protein